MAAREIALLVADVGDDPVALLLESGPRAALEWDHGVRGGLEEDPGAVGVPGGVQVALGEGADRAGPAGDEEDRHLQPTGVLVQAEGWADRRGARREHRRGQSTRCAAEVRGCELLVVRERGL